MKKYAVSIVLIQDKTFGHTVGNAIDWDKVEDYITLNTHYTVN